jgi:hypothetical protein
MRKKILIATLVTFLFLILAGLQQSVFANAGPRDPTCQCQVIGVTCSMDVDCSDYDDSFCADVCAGLATQCNQAWVTGVAPNQCTDHTSFNCACTTGGQ